MCQTRTDRYFTHANHGKKNEASGSGLFRTAVCINERVDSRSGEDETSSEEANNLWDASVWLVLGNQKSFPYSNIVRLLRIGGDSDENTEDAEESIDHRPPCEVWVVSSDVSDDGRDEGYEPGQLFMFSCYATSSHQAVHTIAIEVVAKANGSPIMRPMLNLGPSVKREPPSILRKDGE